MAPSQSPMPTLFVSHGAPDIVLRDMAARDFLKSYAGRIAKPKAILVVSAHFETDGVAIVTDPKPGTVYDFGGFDPRLREIVYGAPGEPAIAERAAGLLEAAGFGVDRVPSRGFDHGVWTPLALGLIDMAVAAIALIAAAMQKPGPELEVAEEMRTLAGTALEEQFHSGVSVGGLAGNLVGGDATAARLLIPVITTIVGALRRRKDSAKS